MTDPRADLAYALIHAVETVAAWGFALPDELQEDISALKAMYKDRRRDEREPGWEEKEIAEAKLERALRKLSKGQMAQLIALLGDPPSMNNVPAAYWDEIGIAMNAEIAPILEDVFLQQAGRLMGETTIGVDWALIHTRAVEWVRRYTFDLVRGINDTTRQALQRAVGAYFEEGLTVGDLERRIEPLFGPVRAEMISVTEITRASVEGERAIVAELAAQGIRMVPVWQTNNDELVCPECGPRHDKEITDGVYPPIHPRCRCWTNHKLVKD